MSYEIALINPRRKSAKRRKASAKQIAARKRFVAKFAKGRKVRAKARKARRGAKFRKSPISGVKSMAKRRRKARSLKGRFVKKTHKTRARRVKRRRVAGKRRAVIGYAVGNKRIRRRKMNPRSRRRYRRNPIGLPSVSGILGDLVPAAYGAAGGIALNLALSYVPLPDMLKTGYARHLTRIGGALAIGWGAKKFLGRRGSAVAQGALTIAVYDLLKEALNMFAPTVGARLGEFEDVTIDDGTDFIDPASPISAYLSGDPDENNGVDGNLDGNLDGLSAYMNGNTLDV